MKNTFVIPTIVASGNGSGGNIDENRIIIKTDTIPTASEDNFKKIYCYSGETNTTYTHGYIYECKAEANYAPIIGLYPTKIGFDYTKGDLVSFWQQATPNFASIHHGIFEYDLSSDIWLISALDKNGNTILPNDWSDLNGFKLYTQDLVDAGFVMLHPMEDYADGEQLEYEIDWHATYSNFYFERIDVQPGTPVIDNVTSTSTTDALSANMGRELQEEITNLQGRGRYLSLWNCATGLAETNPLVSPYEYKAGDYFIVSVVSSTTNYKPNGSSYTIGVASTTVESEAVAVNDCYYFDGTNWQLQINTQKDIAFQNIAGDPYSNTNLATALNIKLQNTATGTDSLTILGTNATSGYSTNIGTDSVVTSSFSTAMGYKAKAAQYSVAIGAAQSSSDSQGAYANSTYTIAVGSNAQATATNCVAIGKGSGSSGTGGYGVALGSQARTTYRDATAIGARAVASAAGAIQIGAGENSTSKTLQAGFYNSSTGISTVYQLLDGTTGKIPTARLPIDGTTIIENNGVIKVASSGAPTITRYKNNTGTTITIADTSSANLVKVYKNGLLLEPVDDYTISGTTLTLVSAITDSDKITLEVF